MDGDHQYMSASVLIPCFNRHELVKRSLYTLTRQTRPVDVFIIDDGSRPGLEVIAFEAGVYYERIRDPVVSGSSSMRGPASAWRHAYYKTDHDFVIITHPEILVPFDAVERMLDQHQSPRRSTPLLYFVNRPLLKKIDEYSWRDDLHSIQQAPGFMGIYNRWGFYNHQMHEWKHHVCFTGQTREEWDVHSFMPAAQKGESHDDAWLWEIEHRLTEATGVNHHVNQIDLTVYHQFHEASRSSVAGNDLWHRQNFGSDPPVYPCSVRVDRLQRQFQADESELNE